MGGTNGTEVTNSVWKIQIAANGTPGTWTPQTPLYEPNMDGVAVHVGDVIFVIGGTNAEGQVVATVQQGLVGGENATDRGPERDHRPVARQRADEPARPAHEPVRVHGQRRDLHPGRLRRHQPAAPDRVDGPGRGRCHPRLEEPAADGPRPGDRRVRRGRVRLARVPHRGPDRRRADGRHRPDEPRAAGAVLPAGHPGHDGPGAPAAGRDRAAARLPQRRHRGRGQLHHPDRHRVPVQPPGQGARPGRDRFRRRG